MAKRSVHVVPHGTSDRPWSVRREGATRVSSLHATKEAATQQGMVTAKREHVELEIHNQDGRIAERMSYGNDPHEARVTSGKAKSAQNLYPILQKNGLFGIWEDRTDIGASAEEANTDDFPSSAPDKRQLTAKDLLESGLVGIWKDRTDIGDTLEFARTLRERTTARRRG